MNVSVSNLATTAHKVDPKYTGVITAWSDNARGVQNGVLSNVGKNITDQRMEAEDDGVIPFLRTSNYDEHLGITSVDNVTMTSDGKTLGDVLKDLNEYTKYTGKTFKNMPDVKKCAIRYQNAFVGVLEGTSRNVAPSNFSYQTRDPENPRNLLLVSTPMGLYAHVDGVGKKRLMPNEVGSDGKKLVNKWLEVKASEHAVGHDMPTLPGDVEKSVQLGVKGSGVRGNRVLIASIPLKQSPPRDRAPMPPPFYLDGNEEDEPVYRSLGCSPVGKTRAAWVGIGSVCDEEDVHEVDLEVDSSEPVVLTQIDYNTVSVPAKNPTVRVADDAIEFAIKDMNFQYNLCESQCKLSQLPVMLHKLTEEHLKEIQDTFDSVAKKAKKDAMAAAEKDPFAPHQDAILVFS